MSCASEVLFFLHKLGIDPQKAGEVFGVSDKEKHTNHYSGWYHIVGELLKGKVDWKNYDDSNAFFPDANSDFRVWFENDPNRMGWIEKDFPTPMLELSFAAVLPAQK